MLWLANLVLCHYYRGIYINLNRKVRVVMRLVDLYKPYVFFTGRLVLFVVMISFSIVFSMYPLIIISFCFPYSFDDSNTEKLRVAIRESDVDENLFYFDPRCIDWEDYIMNTHIPGLTKYSMKP